MAVKPQKVESMINRRRHVRFKPDLGAVGYIDIRADGDFHPTLTALIQQESQGGCGLVVISTHAFKKGDILQVKVGDLSPMKAELRWVRKLAIEVYQLGIEYLE